MHLRTRVSAFVRRSSDKLKRLRSLHRMKSSAPSSSPTTSSAPAAEQGLPGALSDKTLSVIRSAFTHDGSERAILACALRIGLRRLHYAHGRGLVRSMVASMKVRKALAVIASTIMTGNIPHGQTVPSVISAVMAVVSFSYRAKSLAKTDIGSTTELLTDDCMATKGGFTARIAYEHDAASEVVTIVASERAFQSLDDGAESILSGIVGAETLADFDLSDDEYLVEELPYLSEIESLAGLDDECYEFVAESLAMGLLAELPFFSEIDLSTNYYVKSAARAEAGPSVMELLSRLPFFMQAEPLADKDDGCTELAIELSVMKLMSLLPFFLEIEFAVACFTNPAAGSRAEPSAMRLLAQLPFFLQTELPMAGGMQSTVLAEAELSIVDIMAELPFGSEDELSFTSTLEDELADAMASEIPGRVSIDSTTTLANDASADQPKEESQQGVWETCGRLFSSLLPSAVDTTPAFYQWGAHHRFSF